MILLTYKIIHLTFYYLSAETIRKDDARTSKNVLKELEGNYVKLLKDFEIWIKSESY